MKYTNAEIRGAILKAADLFERRPELFRFSICMTPECGAPGCAIGYITHFLGVSGSDFNATAKKIGYENCGLFYCAMDEFSGDIRWIDQAPLVVRALRKMADSKFPADESEQLDPAYLAFKASFTRSVESA